MKFLIPILVIVALAGCTGQRGQQPEDIPTLAAFDPLATAQILTQNAPPEGFRESVTFLEVDANLGVLPGARYVVELEFEGVFSRTTRQTSATATAEVWLQQIGSARRVTVQTAGELLGREDNAFEAVKLGPDAFLVQDGLCLQGGADASTAAGLRAGTLVGGVTRALPAGLKATLNGEDAWKYTFTTADLLLPNIRLGEGGTLAATGGELWVAPAYNAVVRFYVNLDVTNAFIFDRQLPVSGQVVIRYDAYDLGIVPNITTPFGC
jgi:hypothetical protein